MGPIRQILPYYNSGFQSLALAWKPFLQMKLLISFLIINILGDALIGDGVEESAISGPLALCSSPRSILRIHENQ